MKQNHSELVMILDASGSMRPMVPTAVQSHNTFLTDQQAIEDDLAFSRVWFNSNVWNEATNGDPIAEANELTPADYRIGGMTALLDAIGLTIESRPEARNVIVVLITDGLENSSRHFTREQIAAMIKACENERGWQFVFLASGIRETAQARGMGMKGKRALNMGKSPQAHKRAVDLLSLKMGWYRQSQRPEDLDFTAEERAQVDELEQRKADRRARGRRRADHPSND